MLDLVRVQYAANEEMTRVLSSAEAERVRAEKFWASAQERAEKMEAERDEARSDWVALVDEAASTEAERDALRAGSDEDARALLHLNDLLTAAEAEVERLRAEGLAIADGQIADRARLEAERDEWRDTARNEMAGRRAAEAVGALREWREAESLPDCAACSVLDAALAGALA
jgi:hypothetical protein